MKTKLVSFVILLFLNSFLIKAQPWEFVGLDSLVIFHLYVEGDTIYAGTKVKIGINMSAGLYYSSDSGNNWVQLDSSLGDGAILGLEKNIDNTIYIIKCPCQAGFAGTLYKTMNNGQSWEQINNISNYGIKWMRISPFNPNEMYALDVNYLASINYLYRSTDAGVNWEEIGSFPSDSHGNSVAVALDLLHDSTLYAGVSTDLIGDYFFKSTDKGDNWFYVSTPPTVPTEIYTDYLIPDRIYLPSKPYVSNYGGLSWFVADSGFTGNSYYFSFYQDKSTTRLLYILRTDGLYESGNDTFYWNRLEDSEYLPLDLPFGFSNIKNIAIDEASRKIYVGTSNGIYRKSVLTNLSNENNSQIMEFNLEQNFPNPFNPSTTIEYQINRSSLVSLKVYDILGNEIVTLVNKEQPAGKYYITFNVETIEKSNLASGIYIYRVTAMSGERILFSESKRMLMIK